MAAATAETPYKGSTAMAITELAPETTPVETPEATPEATPAPYFPPVYITISTETGQTGKVFNRVNVCDASESVVGKRFKTMREAVGCAMYLADALTIPYLKDIVTPGREPADAVEDSGFRCLPCEKTFKTERGMNTHNTVKHPKA